ncbi:AAA family ATPase, partial [Mycolicibacterium llatzerense]|uniref:AAA family ATPase n=1 Tax=Mycolicibacterium llatzerense TaxID=280871 RepID=UPI0008DE1700
MRTLPKNFTASPAGSSVAAAPVVRVASPVKAVHTAPVHDWPGRELMADPMLARILLAVWSGDPLCVTPAAPGSGKSRLATLLAAALAHRAGLRVGVAAQTREQALELARRMSAISDRYALIVSAATAKAGVVNGIRTVTGSKVRWSHSTGGAVLIGTAARWLYVDPAVGAADVLLIDEAWQATYADAGALGALARQIVLVGDSGQIAPVVTGSTARWDGHATGPHQSAPAALLAAHGSAATVHELTNSWRLGPKTCAMLSEHFYPQMPFTSRRPDEAVITDAGQDLSEIACLPVRTRNGPTDPVLMEALADRVRELLNFQYRRGGQRVALSGEDIAVVVPHVAQAGAVRALLSDVDGVMIGTSNGLQGQERPAVVALHPMAGYRQVQSFAIDPGRTCVTLSRHRGHMTLVTDPATMGLLAAD